MFCNIGFKSLRNIQKNIVCKSISQINIGNKLVSFPIIQQIQSRQFHLCLKPILSMTKTSSTISNLYAQPVRHMNRNARRPNKVSYSSPLYSFNLIQ